MKFLRWLVGRIILVLDFITSPRAMKRSPEVQEKVNEQTKRLRLYQFEACPFCVKVRRQIKRLNLKIELKDAKNNSTDREALLQARGKVKVPVLRIESENAEVQWMPESSDINAYLESRFSSEKPSDKEHAA